MAITAALHQLLQHVDCVIKEFAGLRFDLAVSPYIAYETIQSSEHREGQKQAANKKQTIHKCVWRAHIHRRNGFAREIEHHRSLSMPSAANFSLLFVFIAVQVSPIFTVPKTKINYILDSCVFLLDIFSFFDRRTSRNRNLYNK